MLITKHPFDIHIFVKAASGEQRDSISVDCCIGSLPYLSPTHLIHSGPSLRLIVKLFLKPHNVYNPVNILSVQSIRFSLIVQYHGELIHRCQLFNIFDVHHASWNMAGFLRSLWKYRNYIVIVLTPLILLPLPLISPTSVRKKFFFTHRCTGQSGLCMYRSASWSVTLQLNQNIFPQKIRHKA